MQERALDRFDARLFVKKDRPENAASVGVDEDRQPEPVELAPGGFINGENVYQVVVGEDILEGKVAL
jgi:hypothetical protein